MQAPRCKLLLRLKKRTPAASVRSIEAQRAAAGAQPTSSPRPMTLTSTFHHTATVMLLLFLSSSQKDPSIVLHYQQRLRSMVASDPGWMNALVVVGGQVPSWGALPPIHPQTRQLSSLIFWCQPLISQQSSKSLLAMIECL